MKDKQAAIQQIQSNVMEWSRKMDLQDYLKDELSKTNQATGKKHIEDIVDHAIIEAKVESEPRWTKLLFDNIKSDNKQTPTQTNIFLEMAAKSNDSIDKLVGASTTKKKSTIMDII